MSPSTEDPICGILVHSFAVLSRNFVTFCEEFFMRKPGTQESSKKLRGFLVSLLIRFWMRLGRAMPWRLGG